MNDFSPEIGKILNMEPINCIAGMKQMNSSISIYSKEVRWVYLMLVAIFIATLSFVSYAGPYDFGREQRMEACMDTNAPASCYSGSGSRGEQFDFIASIFGALIVCWGIIKFVRDHRIYFSALLKGLGTGSICAILSVLLIDKLDPDIEMALGWCLVAAIFFISFIFQYRHSIKRHTTRVIESGEILDDGVD